MEKKQLEPKQPKPKQITHIYTQPHWQISYVNDPIRFFGVLPVIIPFGSILSFEGYKPARVFRDFLKTYAPKNRIEYLTDERVWLEQIRFTKAFAQDFAAFYREDPRQAKFAHLHGFHKEPQMLFWFHDAFQGGDLSLARTVSASKVRRFCSQLGPQFSLKEPIA